jgi:hypothetical protein
MEALFYSGPVASRVFFNDFTLNHTISTSIVWYEHCTKPNARTATCVLALDRLLIRANFLQSQVESTITRNFWNDILLIGNTTGIDESGNNFTRSL